MLYEEDKDVLAVCHQLKQKRLKTYFRSSFSSHLGMLSTSIPLTSIAHITYSELYLHSNKGWISFSAGCSKLDDYGMAGRAHLHSLAAWRGGRRGSIKYTQQSIPFSNHLIASHLSASASRMIPYLPNCSVLVGTSYIRTIQSVHS